MEKIICENQAQLPEVAKAVISICKGLDVWVFMGDLGAGKTTLIKAIANEMGVEDLVSSPTFSIINEYQNGSGQRFYHFDFYRIEDPEEVLEIGVDEYFYSGNYCWIEWAEKIPEYIPESFYLISIKVENDQKREITIKKVQDGGENC
ncbi:tRNA (adenosine(37)-N6)-threonylcarbamoyltransferase complex ATPase subunit type 1 TsaE [Echinicola jeungdonensis]|uniref:tRNA threonylcarbamoyladenosine biosynthesis protein TsaE n=1 Tax=Echinicola jeungdonensis TaxID=709343 RepID=A0ABV5J858_9BACT|nr:tRNA (adenosine(37)-N6)-threonylcarbamoyltransferase complex ATPase subunit type 1 TsaE [Echinicola jeungdonensis]MDN3669921.1 tRNA (adenosine(37)-N6)-threonylcarbamoyltransferase complex ATPase subunit type 1 TsaE [Echinicola jeungdonensis]